MEAPHAAHALELCDLSSDTLDMLVTDLVMPGMNGAELARRVAKLRPGIRVLFISGYSEHSAMGNEHQPDARNFLQKPFSPAEFLGRVRAVLDDAAI
jgi:DNA-binding NtrC family response regulator